MTILFLDFDGVLHPETDDNPAFFTRNTLLHEILRRDNSIMVVFTTTWRSSRTVAKLASLVCHGGGEDLLSRFVGSTPDLDKIPDPGARGEECMAWMKKIGWSTLDWIALDDNPDWFSTRARVVGIDPQKGLVVDDIERVLLLAEKSRAGLV